MNKNYITSGLGIVRKGKVWRRKYKNKSKEKFVILYIFMEVAKSDMRVQYRMCECMRVAALFISYVLFKVRSFEST